MTRAEAIDLLARHEVSRLGPEEREALLIDWWSIDAEDPEYDELPDLVRAAIKRFDSPDDPQKRLYDPLLWVAVRHSFFGVINPYLERRLADLGRFEAVEDREEELEICRCCGYRSLRERGGYEICQVCFWEDDGTTNPESISAPNHMTLREARRNFDEIGAISQAAMTLVLPDGRGRYARGDRSA
jgi:hypothetical protein